MIVFRRGLNADRLTITPAEGELLYCTDTKLWYGGDGSTVGGNPIDASPGVAVWGLITGTLAAQTDLQTALDLKSDVSFTIAMAAAL